MSSVLRCSWSNRRRDRRRRVLSVFKSVNESVKTFEVTLVLKVDSRLPRQVLKRHLWNMANVLEGVRDIDISSVSELEPEECEVASG